MSHIFINTLCTIDGPRAPMNMDDETGVCNRPFLPRGLRIHEFITAEQRLVEAPCRLLVLLGRRAPPRL